MSLEKLEEIFPSDVQQFFEKLIVSAQGMGFLAIITGVILRLLPGEIKIRPEYETSEAVIQARKIASNQSDHYYCSTFDPEMAKRICYVAPHPINPIIDLFPINSLFGIPIPRDFGRVLLSDALIGVGLIAIAGPGIKEGIGLIRGR